MKMSNGFFFETIKKNNWQLYKSNNGAQKKNLARPKIENWKLQIEKNWKLQQIFYENNLHQENGRDKINLKKQFFIHFLPCCFFLNWIKFSLFFVSYEKFKAILMGEKRKKSHKNINSVDNDWPLKQQNKANGNKIYLESGELSLTKQDLRWWWWWWQQ